MIERIMLPRFDANITEATLGEWHKREGDPVKKGDVLVDVITDKANFELTAEVEGVLRRIVAPEKSQVPVGYVVALVGDAEDELPDVSEENARRMAEHLASAAGRMVSAPTESSTTPTAAKRQARVRATPRARRLARENHIDLADVQRRAGGDMVTEKDVQDYLREKT